MLASVCHGDGVVVVGRGRLIGGTARGAAAGAGDAVWASTRGVVKGAGFFREALLSAFAAALAALAAAAAFRFLAFAPALASAAKSCPSYRAAASGVFGVKKGL